MIQTYVSLSSTEPGIVIEPFHLSGPDTGYREFRFGNICIVAMGPLDLLRPHFALPHGYGRDEMFEYGQPVAPESC
jgi:hypothetical protein